MAKTKIDCNVSIYPMPVVLAGAVVQEKANFLAIGWIARVNYQPPMVAMSLGKRHYTNSGIREHREFSVNFPGVTLLEKTDYCGLVSGKNVDKSKLFKIFYGELKTAPMIEECPVNMECRLVKNVDFPSHDIFMGEVVAAYCDESVLNEEEKLDYTILKPILFTMHDAGYWKLGERFADAWSVGKSLK